MKQAFFFSFFALVFVLGAWAFIMPTLAAETASLPPQDRLIEIPPGMTSVDLTADGVPEVIMKIAHDNRNGYIFHSIIFFSYYSINENPKDSKLYFQRNSLMPQRDWNRINESIGSSALDRGPFTAIDIWDRELTGVQSLETQSTVEYMVADYRLLFKNGKTYLLKGTKIYSYPDGSEGEDRIEFKFFELMKNEGEDILPTVPLYRFESVKKWETEKKYKNIEDAFLNEEGSIVNFIQ